MDNLEQKYELLKAQAISDEVEIDRLKQANFELRKKIETAISFLAPSGEISHKAYRKVHRILKGN